MIGIILMNDQAKQYDIIPNYLFADIPLYEDWELHCFIPLLSFQKLVV